MIRFKCNWCGKRYRAPKECAGRADYCNACGKPVWVPQPHLHFTCVCGKKYKTSTQYAGQTLPCRQCGRPVTAPPLAIKDPLPPEKGAHPSLFELDPHPEMKMADEVYQYFNVPPYEILPEPIELPAAEVVDPSGTIPKASPAPMGDAIPAVASPPDTFVPPPLPPLAEPPRPLLLSDPLAEELLQISTENLPPINFDSSASRIVEPPLAESRLVESRSPEPAKKQKGCPICGSEAAYTVHSRSPLGIFLMLGGALGGLTSVSFIERNYLYYGLATLLLFGIAVAGSFMKRWIMLCSGCERRIQ